LTDGLSLCFLSLCFLSGLLTFAMQKPIPISISSYQLKPILILGLSLFIQVFLGAEDRIAWGKPVKGVRLGIKNAPSSATSDQDLTFTVMLQNVSDKTITLPQPGTFSLKKDLQSEDYHAAPLFPLIEKTRFSPSSVMLESAWSLGNSGVPVGQAPDKVITLEPSKSVAWDSVRLEKYDYYGDRLPPKMNTRVQHWNLLPRS